MVRKNLPQMYKTEDVMEIFDVSRTTIDDWRKKGILPYTKVGKFVFFNKKKIAQILNEEHSKTPE